MMENKWRSGRQFNGFSDGNAELHTLRGSIVMTEHCESSGSYLSCRVFIFEPCKVERNSSDEVYVVVSQFKVAQNWKVKQPISLILHF